MFLNFSIFQVVFFLFCYFDPFSLPLPPFKCLNILPSVVVASLMELLFHLTVLLVSSPTWQPLCSSFSLLDRPYWRCYYSNTDAVIYVVDSSDRDRMGISKSELVAMLEVSGPIFQLQAKKQIRYEGMSLQEMTQLLDRFVHILKMIEFLYCHHEVILSISPTLVTEGWEIFWKVSVKLPNKGNKIIILNTNWNLLLNTCINIRI